MRQAVADVTGRIRERSGATRRAYLARIDAMLARPRGPERLGCANRREAAALPHAQAANNAHDLGRELFAGMRKNVVSAEEGACTWL